MRIVYVSDFDFKASGYFNLSIPLCTGLVEKGHEVKVLGLGYKGENHTYPFSIIPVANFQEIVAMLQNLVNVWMFDRIIVALDIPLQRQMLNYVENRPKEIKYIGIMAIESDPLVIDWAMYLMKMDKQLIISQFGTEEANKIGIPARHIQIGVDTDSWRLPTEEERIALRKTFMIEEDEYVVLTVADNQERKNLWAGFDIFSQFHAKYPKSRYILVTREHSPVGWNLRTMAQDMKFANSLMIFERGMSFKDLWSIYAASDCFLLPSKAEGLGMPLLEAMAMQLPCIGTDCTGIRELLSDGRGFLVDHEYMHVDPFGNGHRYWINRMEGTKVLEYVYTHKLAMKMVRDYVEKRKWSIAVETLNNAIMEN